jgi:hypothetical protein
MLSLYIHLVVVNDDNERAPVRLNLGSNQGGQCFVSLGLVGQLWFPSVGFQGVPDTVDMSLRCGCSHPLAG